MENFITALFRDIIENKDYDEALINKYFSKNFIQIVDNQILDFESFKKHIQKLKTKTYKQQVIFANILSNGNFIFTKHYVESVLKNGDKVKHKVFAEFKIEEGKVILCDELTILMEGNKNEGNLGSER